MRDGRGSGRWRPGRTTCAGRLCRWESSLSDSDSRLLLTSAVFVAGVKREDIVPALSGPHWATSRAQHDRCEDCPGRGPELPKGAQSLVERWPGSEAFRKSGRTLSPSRAGLSGGGHESLASVSCSEP